MNPEETAAHGEPRQRPRFGRGRRRSHRRSPQTTESAPVSRPEPQPESVPAVEPTPAPATPPSGSGWLCDAMLGRLAREMRLLGMDVEYNRSVSGMQAYKAARESGRTLLTRNKRMMKLPGAMFITSQVAAEQIAQVRGEPIPEPTPAEVVVAEAPIPLPSPRPAPRPQKPREETPFGRCIECNSPLEKITRDQARPLVPFFVYQIHHDFKRCPKCRRVYWPGNHVEDMRERVPARESRRPGPRQSQSRRPRRG